MKILILSTSECTGGAAIAARRLMIALNKCGHQAAMLVRDKSTDSPNVISINTSRFNKVANFLRFAWERWVIFTHNRLSRKNLFGVSIANTGTDISRHPMLKDADIIHLHWINQGFLSLKNIKQLAATGKPVVWTMHDMWCGTGICHYVANSCTAPHKSCANYQTCCGACPMLAKPSARDLAYKVFGSKKFLGHSGIHYVGCSHWIADCARHSALLGSADITAVPNPIDTDIFSPADKAAARQRFDLPVNKKLILFAAVNLSDLRKGILYFIEACRHLSPQNVEVAFMGGSIGGDLQRAMPVPSRALGYLHGAKDIAEAYSAADVFVTASLSENLPNTVMEAMSCGTPCVGFNVGGIPEMIDHQENGYVAKYMDTHDLAHGIQWLLYQSDYDKLCKNARIKAQTSYSESIVAAQYVNLYQKLLLK